MTRGKNRRPSPSPETQHPFDRTKVSSMVGLEDRYHQKKYDIKLLDDLCKLYSDLVEYYDVKGDPIKYYFLEKIQAVASSKRFVDSEEIPQKPIKKKLLPIAEIPEQKSNLRPKDSNPQAPTLDTQVNGTSTGDIPLKTGPENCPFRSRQMKRAKDYQFNTKLDSAQTGHKDTV